MAQDVQTCGAQRKLFQEGSSYPNSFIQQTRKAQIHYITSHHQKLK